MRPAQRKDFARTKTFIQDERCAITPRLRTGSEIFVDLVFTEDTITLFFAFG
jgi:hypothetical protein